MSEFLASYGYALKIVAVGIGVLVGLVFGRVLAPLFGKRRLVRLPVILGCGAVGGCALWWALGHLGGLGNGNGAGPGNKGPGTIADNPGASNTKPLPGERAAPTRQTIVSVRMLGGDAVKADRIYSLDGQPSSWDELRQALDSRLKQDPDLHTIEIQIYPDSVDPQNPAVTDLVDWAKRHKIQASISFPNTAPRASASGR